MFTFSIYNHTKANAKYMKNQFAAILRKNQIDDMRIWDLPYLHPPYYEREEEKERSKDIKIFLYANQIKINLPRLIWALIIIRFYSFALQMKIRILRYDHFLKIFFSLVCKHLNRFHIHLKLRSQWKSINSQ